MLPLCSQSVVDRGAVGVGGAINEVVAVRLALLQSYPQLDFYHQNFSRIFYFLFFIVFHRLTV